jgi:hypothetical protein
MKWYCVFLALDVSTGTLVDAKTRDPDYSSIESSILHYNALSGLEPAALTFLASRMGQNLLEQVFVIGELLKTIHRENRLRGAPGLPISVLFLRERPSLDALGSSRKLRLL